MDTLQVYSVRTNMDSYLRDQIGRWDVPGIVPSSCLTCFLMSGCYFSNTWRRVKNVQATVVAKEKIRCKHYVLYLYIETSFTVESFLKMCWFHC